MKQLYIDIRNQLLSISCGKYTYAETAHATGLNDVTFNSGPYLGNTLQDTFTITISSVNNAGGAPDTFNWTSNNGSGANVPIASPYTTPPYTVILDNGIYVTFANATGHTLNDSWVFTVQSNPVIQHCRVWNNQVRFEQQGQLPAYPKPAVFVEMLAPNNFEQMGNGVQLLNALIIRLHIIHEWYNSDEAPGALFEEDLAVLDLKEQVYYAMNNFEPANAAALVRTAEVQQYDHNNIYHFIQDYKTNYVDTIASEPLYEITKPPVTELYMEPISPNSTFYVPEPFIKAGE